MFFGFGGEGWDESERVNYKSDSKVAPKQAPGSERTARLEDW